MLARTRAIRSIDSAGWLKLMGPLEFDTPMAFRLLRKALEVPFAVSNIEIAAKNFGSTLYFCPAD